MQDSVMDFAVYLPFRVLKFRFAHVPAVFVNTILSGVLRLF